MKKIIFFFLLFGSLAFGYSYNELLIKAQASIFPKILLLDKKLKEKLIDGKIVYTITYEESDHHTALQIRELINKHYKQYLDEYPYEINLVSFSDLTQDTRASAIYALNSDANIDKVAQIARQKGIIAFAYDIENLKKGLLLSLMLEKTTVLYLSKENLRSQNVDFVDSLFQIVKFINVN